MRGLTRRCLEGAGEIERTQAGLLAQRLDGQVFVGPHLLWKGVGPSALSFALTRDADRRSAVQAVPAIRLGRHYAARAPMLVGRPAVLSWLAVWGGWLARALDQR